MEYLRAELRPGETNCEETVVDLKTTEDAITIEASHSNGNDTENVVPSNVSVIATETQNCASRPETNLRQTNASDIPIDKDEYITLLPFNSICETCGEKFQLESQLNHHKVKHMISETYICNICNEVCTTKTNLERHVYNTHTSKLENKCKVCKVLFKYEYQLKVHLKKTHSKEKCLDMSTRNVTETSEPKDDSIVAFSNSEDDVSQSKTEEVGEESAMFILNDGVEYAINFACKTCGEGFQFESSLKEHETIHLKNKSYQCKICNKVCKRKSYLQQHMFYSHNNNSEIKCLVCSKVFKYEFQLKAHSYTHSKEKTFKCELCDRAYKSSSGFYTHRIHSHGEPERHTCNICQKSFKWPTSLNQHMARHNQDTPHKCHICGIIFFEPEQLKEHLLTHLKECDYVCTICGKMYKLSQSLSYHMLTHKNERNFKCNICGKSFLKKYALELHTKIHTGERDHVCVECGRAFTQASTLKTHFKLVHLKVKARN